MIWPKLLLITVMAVSMSVSYDHTVNYWEAFAPGKLLQRLDALTQSNTAGNLNITPAQAKADDDIPDEVDDDAAIELSAETSREEGLHSTEDYERNYEQFVREHFDRATDDEEEDDNAENDADASLEAEASHVQNQRCRRVEKKGQLCEICRQPTNGEVSETCSYSHADQPQQYAYGSESQYKRYRDNNQPNEELTSKPSSLCVRRLQDNRVCYDCQDSRGNQLERCYDTEKPKKMQKSQRKTRRSKTSTHTDKKGPEAQKSQHTEQRIYKRTISYSYAQGSNQDEDVNATTPATAGILSIPHHQPDHHHPHQRRSQSQVNHKYPPFPTHDSSSSQQQ